MFATLAYNAAMRDALIPRATPLSDMTDSADAPSRVVHKFGGSSLADASRFRRVADIVVGAAGGAALRRRVGDGRRHRCARARRAARRRGRRHLSRRDRARSRPSPRRRSPSCCRRAVGAELDARRSIATSPTCSTCFAPRRCCAASRATRWSSCRATARCGRRRFSRAAEDDAAATSDWLDARDVLTVTRTETGGRRRCGRQSRERVDAWVDRRGRDCRRRSSSPASSRRPPTASSPRSAATAAISARRSSPRCSTPRRFTSGPTWTA